MVIRKFSRISACVLGAMLSCSLLFAQPASAATSVGWSGSAATPNAVSDTSFVLASTSGSRIFISSNFVQGPGGFTCNTNTNRTNYCEIPAGTSKTFTILPNAVAGTVQFNDSASMFAITISTMTVTYQQTIVSQATEPAPVPILQQVGRPVSGSCEDLVTEELHLAGVASGGWGESWAQWMNDGTGGFVCSRTLVYSNNANAWSIA